MAFPVDGKTALVTGGGSGICFAFTKLLLSRDCNVLIADLKLTPEAEEFITAHQAREGKAKVVFLKTDVTDWKQLQATFDTAIAEFGELDIVCPGAGIFDPTSFWNFQDSNDEIETNSYKTFDINITHPIRVTQLAIDQFKRQNRGGAVVLVSSIAAQLPSLVTPLYSASKAAISSFTKAMAMLEPKYGIRVNAVAPGMVKTPIWGTRKDWIDEDVDEWVSRERIAGVMLKLVESEEYVGGTVLEVGSETVRSVEMLNDPGPKGTKGCTAANTKKGFVEAFGLIEEQFGK